MMEKVVRSALGGEIDFERFDSRAAKQVFELLNEEWEEHYAAAYEVTGHAENTIPKDFLMGRKAFLFHMFYRVVELHEEEVERIEKEGRWTVA
jgi:hypothetical protein